VTKVSHLVLWMELSNDNIDRTSFNGHFPGEPGLASAQMSPLWIPLELRMMEVVTSGAIRHA